MVSNTGALVANRAEKPVVLITGAGGGLGLVTAQLFHDRGAQVVAVDRAPEGLRSLAIERAGILTGCFDVADAQAVEEFTAEILGRFDRIDTLINNVGAAGPTGPVEETSLDEWRATVDVNLNAIFYFVRATVPRMKVRRSGCILNVSTASVRTGLPFRTAYVASKSALSGMTLNLARELGPYNIRCNSVLPGAIRNERGSRIIAERAAAAGITSEEEETKLLQHISMRTWIEPVEIAETFYFLASDAARHISGQEIGVCGNMEWE